MKAQFTFFLNNIITQNLISATKAWFDMSRHILHLKTPFMLEAGELVLMHFTKIKV